MKKFKILLLLIPIFFIVFAYIFFQNYSLFIVYSQSMTGEIERGDFVLVQKCTIENLNIGDNIAYKDNQNNIVVIHKVVEVLVNENYKIKTASIYPKLQLDENLVENNLIGKVVFNNANLGKLFSNVHFVAIFLIILILILIFLKNKRKKYFFAFK